MKNTKEYLVVEKEEYKKVFQLFDGFTLSLKRSAAPNRETAERLICQLVRDCLEEEAAKGSVTIWINTDNGLARSSGYHVAFDKPLSVRDSWLIERGMEIQRKRRRLGSGVHFYRGALCNAEHYFWRQSGVPSKHKIRLRKRKVDKQ